MGFSEFIPISVSVIQAPCLSSTWLACDGFAVHYRQEWAAASAQFTVRAVAPHEVPNDLAAVSLADSDW
jgi:hypothetical protein